MARILFFSAYISSQSWFSSFIGHRINIDYVQQEELQDFLYFSFFQTKNIWLVSSCFHKFLEILTIVSLQELLEILRLNCHQKELRASVEFQEKAGHRFPDVVQSL